MRVVEFPTAYTQVLRLYGVSGNYAAIYASQPNVRTAIQTVAREAAALTMKLYYKKQRDNDLGTSREPIDDEDMARLLDEPTPGMSQYRFWFQVFSDIEIYDIAYLWKVRVSGRVRALKRIPPQSLYPVRDPLTYSVTGFRTARGDVVLPRDVIVFWGYDPATNDGFIPPMESIRRIIAEDVAAGIDREGRWRNSARKEGVIETDVSAEPLGDEAKESFYVDLEDSLGGPGGSGRPLVLEPGQSYKDITWSPRDMEYLNARKLSRLETAAHFHIPPAMMAAAGNNAEADANTLTYFYKSSLPPRLVRVEGEIEAQLMPEFYPQAVVRRDYYVAFNLDEKLRGSFEEKAAIMATTVGGPVVTVNEGRSRLNLPATDNPLDDLIYAPSNSVRGGGTQASPQNPMETPATNQERPAIEPAGTTPQPRGASFDPAEWLVKADAAAARAARESEMGSFLMEQRVRTEERARQVFERTFERQSRINGPLKLDRWNKELSDDLFSLWLQAGETVGERVAEEVEGEWDTARTANLIRKRAETVAAAVNEESNQRLSDETEPDEVFNAERAGTLALQAATWVTSWAQQEVWHQNGED